MTDLFDLAMPWWEFVLRAVDHGLGFETLPDGLAKRRIHDANVSHHHTDSGGLELLAIARARIARSREPPA